MTLKKSASSITTSALHSFAWLRGEIGLCLANDLAVIFYKFFNRFLSKQTDWRIFAQVHSLVKTWEWSKSNCSPISPPHRWWSGHAYWSRKAPYNIVFVLMSFSANKKAPPPYSIAKVIPLKLKKPIIHWKAQRVGEVPSVLLQLWNPFIFYSFIVRLLRGPAKSYIHIEQWVCEQIFWSYNQDEGKLRRREKEIQQGFQERF